MKMKSLIIGASGATGKHLVEQLLKTDQYVKIIVRSIDNIPKTWLNHPRIEIIISRISSMSVEEMTRIVEDCQAVASCLGHRLSFKGIYGKPRRLVLNTVKLVCKSVKSNSPLNPLKFVLMNTSGNSNRDLNEPSPLKNKIVVRLLRMLLPPHPDNEKAAEYLRVNIGQDDLNIQWVAVRPDDLINEDKVSKYELHPSPVRNPIFDAGKTSRINVANFMARLIKGNSLWDKWKGQMPVIYNITDMN